MIKEQGPTPAEQATDGSTVGGIHQALRRLEEILPSREAGSKDPEVQGEYPGSEVPVEVIVKDEDKLQRLEEWAREHKKEVVVTSTLATGAIVALVGVAWALKRLKEKEKRSKK